MKPLDIVFAGTPDFAVPGLEALSRAGHRLRCVLTQPDRPAGRGRKPVASPVKARALALGLTVLQPASLREASLQQSLKDISPDLLVVVAYGLMVPSAVLALPRFGCVNIHASLLPRWRGAAPIQRAILAGDRQTGVSIMQMDAGLDTGPVWLSREIPILPTDTGGSLHERLAALGAEALLEALPAIAGGHARPVPQPEAGASYAAKLEKREALIDWRKPAGDLERMVRAFNPWPVAETRYGGQQLRIWEAGAVAGPPGQQPGKVLGWDRDGIQVATGNGVLRLRRVQLPGRRAVSGSEFANAHALAGVSLGQ